MKKLILSLLACGTVAAAQAQSGLLIYGTGTYSSSRGSNSSNVGGITTSTDLQRDVRYQIAPGIGWSLNKEWAVGLDFDFSGGKTTLQDAAHIPAGDPYELKRYSLGVGPFVRYTQMMGEHFFVFGQFTAHYNRGDQREIIRPNSELKNTFMGLDASFVPAVGFKFSPTVGLSFGVGGVSYNYQKYNYDVKVGSNSDKTSAFDVTFGQQFVFSLQKYCNWAPKSRHRSDAEMEEMDNTRRMDKTNDE